MAASNTPVSTGAAPAVPLSRARRTAAALRLLRPAQWTKNVFVLAGLVFGRQFVHGQDVARAAVAVAVFCLLSSAMYCVNDAVDRDRDRLHPVKRWRPVASGAVTPWAAVAIGACLAALGLALTALLGRAVLEAGVAYLGLQLAYSLGLKRVAIWDALGVAGGFVLRALGGTLALGLPASPWLLVCTYLLTLYVSLAKRWSDAVDLSGAERAYRGAALVYEPGTMRLFMQVTMSATLISYALYATEGTYGPRMLLTLPFVIYGLFRYQHLVERRGLGGMPDTAVLADRAFLLNGAGFVLVAVGTLLLPPHAR